MDIANSVSSFELPLLPNNLPSGCHPDSVSLSKELDEWLISKLKITDDIAKKKAVQSRIMLFTCYMYPNGARDRVLLAGKHLWVCFLVDDILEFSSREDYSGVKSVVWSMAAGSYNKSTDAHHPVLLLYKEVLDELRTAMPESLFTRYTRILASYLDAVREEVEYKLKDTIPSSDEYRLLRRRTGFMDVMGCIMTEFCAGIQLQESLLNSPDVRELVNLMSDHVVMVNDLLSLRKEYYSDGRCHNWVFVLLATFADFQEAVDKVCDMIKQVEDSILVLQEKFINKAKAENNVELLKFAQNVPMAASGHLRWSFITARYHGCDNPLLDGELFHGTLMLNSDATVVVPLVE